MDDDKNILKEVPGVEDWVDIKPIIKGWSKEKKFRVKTSSGKYLLVRISNITEYKTKKSEFERVKKISLPNTNISRPVTFGLTKSKKNVYTIYTWIEGSGAQKAVPTLAPKHQYALGREGGKILRKIHQIPAPQDQEPWDTKFERKVRNRLREYKKEQIKLEYENRIIEFLLNHLHLMRDRPQTLQHGDFHLGNLIVCFSKKKKMKEQLGVIDFNRVSYGDPWEEFERWVFTAKYSPEFMNGQIHAYFEDNIPEIFFELMATYTAYSLIASIPWALRYGPEEVENMLELSNYVIKMYDEYQTNIPNWYKHPK